MSDIIKNVKKWLFVSIWAVSYVTYVLFAIWGEKYLYADGVNYFHNVVSTGNYMIYPVGRTNCDILMQIFAICAYRLNCTSFKVMGALFGFGLTFWTVLFYSLAIAICLRHKKETYAELVFVFSAVSMIFTGFFVQIESLIGTSVYILESVLYLLHEDNDKTVGGYAELELILLFIPLTIHLNEYYSFWGLILAFMLLYRMFWSSNKLGKRWLILSILQVGIAIISINDIGAKEDAPNFLMTFKEMAMHGKYIVWIILTLLVILLSYEKVKIKRKKLLILLLEAALFCLTFWWVRYHASDIAKESYNLRFTNLGWGILFVLVLVFMEKRMLKMQSIISLCVVIAMGFSLFNLKSAIEFRRYNSGYVQFAIEHAGEGFVEKEGAVFQYSPYRWYWTVGLESVCVQALRGAEVIDCIVLGDRVDFFDEGDIGFYGNMSRYGVTYDYSAFY